MAPKVVASPDGAHLAILHDGRLSLYSLEDGGRLLAAADVIGQDVVFCGPHLLLHAHDPDRSLLTLLSVPTLAAVSGLELQTPTRLQAASGAYALLDQGDQALMAQGTSGTVAAAPLRPPAAFTRAVGLEASQFVTFGTRGAEVWDATTRRPLARLGLVLPDDTLDIGLTNRGASLWIATRQPALHVARISDGRISTLRLDAQPRHVRSHPSLAWVVADVGDRTLAINLAIKEIEDATVAAGVVVAITPMRDRGTGAMLVALDRDRLYLRPVGGEPDEVTETGAVPETSAAPPMPVRDAPTAPTAATSGVTTTSTAARPLTVRERLAQRTGRDLPATDPTPSPTPSPSPHPSAGPAPRLVVDPRTIPMLDPSAQPSPAPASQVAAGAPTPPPPPTPPRALAPVPPSTEPEGWREALLGWARITIAERPSAPPLEGSPLHGLRERLRLTPAAGTILYALYAAWLGGRGETGISIARLAELSAFAGEDAWAEARGVGHLDELGLVEWAFGRARLTTATAEFLDGRPATVIERVGAGAINPLPEGVFRVDAERGESARACALRITHVLGQQLVYALGVVALCEPEGTSARAARPVIEQGRLQAWLRGLPLASTFDLSTIAPRPAETLLWIVPGGMPDRPGGPPRWRL